LPLENSESKVMDAMYEEALKNMEQTVHRLAARVPEPVKVTYKDSFVFRYKEQTVNQAIVLKLARVVSGLHALRLLMERGFIQEQASLQRIQDELNEDISFLSLAASQGATDLHKEFLSAFWEEEFDKESALESTQKRPMIKRQKIRAFLARAFEDGPGTDQSTTLELGRTLSKSYSGYVHGAAPQIMDMYGGNPMHFHVRGLRGTPMQEEHRQDLWNYFFRSILACAAAEAAFGDSDAVQAIKAFADAFAKQEGQAYFD
jgi:hypothetical protein